MSWKMKMITIVMYFVKCKKWKRQMRHARQWRRLTLALVFSARCVRYNVRCSSVCLSVCPSGTGVHCDHRVHVSADLSFIWLNGPTLWAPWNPKHAHLLPGVSTCYVREVWYGLRMCKLGVITQERLKIQVKLPLTANRKSYMARRLAHQWMTLSDLQCRPHQNQHHPHRALSLQ